MLKNLFWAKFSPKSPNFSSQQEHLDHKLDSSPDWKLLASIVIEFFCGNEMIADCLLHVCANENTDQKLWTLWSVNSCLIDNNPNNLDYCLKQRPDNSDPLEQLEASKRRVTQQTASADWTDSQPPPAVVRRVNTADLTVTQSSAPRLMGNKSKASMQSLDLLGSRPLRHGTGRGR